MTSRRTAFLAAFLFTVLAMFLSAIRPLWVDEILQLIETRQPSAIRMIVDLRRNPESSARPTAALRSENMFIDEFLDLGAVSVLAVNLTSVICPHRNSLTIKGIL